MKPIHASQVLAVFGAFSLLVGCSSGDSGSTSGGGGAGGGSTSASGSGGATSGSTTSASGSSSTGTGGVVSGLAYGDCGNGKACGLAAETCTTGDNIFGKFSVCSAPCTQVADCPEKPSDFDASTSVVCAGGKCAITCGSCPSGATCNQDANGKACVWKN